MDVLTIVTNLIGPLMEVRKWIFYPVGRQIGYCIHYKDNIRNLEKQIEYLMAKRRDIQKFVDAARMRGDGIQREVERWRTSVDAIQVEVQKCFADNELTQTNGKCFIGCCPARYNLGKRAAKQLKEVDKLLMKAPSSDKVCITPLPSDLNGSLMKTEIPINCSL
uniref:Disease resistance protein n=1 Tax=Nelumbo nucifera TaxID=4432 RepID=A0A822ZDH8_NELNU|nr:TPA_asm: hypothetical protein HUJ06_013961 [Nelumbo nucifera]